MSNESEHRGRIFRVRSDHIDSFEFQGVFDLHQPDDATDLWSKARKTAATFPTHEKACDAASAAACDLIDREADKS